MKSIFAGIKILDMTKVFSGPFATRMLADYGAEVLKIEHPDNRDDSREFPPIKNGRSGYFEIVNRNKLSINFDLKNPIDRKRFYKLIETSDVFVENLTPHVKKNLLISYDILKSINPRLIYASLSGKGQDNDRKYYDVIAQAESGLMSLTGSKNKPMKIGPAVIDAFSGMTLAFAISSALYYREKTGKGQYLDVSMLGCAMNLLENNLISYSITGKNPKRTGNIDNAIAPFGVFKCQDSYVAIAAGNDGLWKKLSEFLSINEIKYSTNQLRLDNANTLTHDIENRLAKYPGIDLIKELTLRGIPCSKINEMSDLAKDDSLFAQGYLRHMHHRNLGDCIIPGSSINFSQMDEMKIKEAP